MTLLSSLGIAALCVGAIFQPIAACAEQTSGTAIQLVSFAQDIAPVLRTRCAVCHMTGSEPGNLRLYPSAAYDSLVGASSVSTGKWLVSAGKPEESYLVHKIKGTHLEVGGEGSRMPQGQNPLGQEVISLIETWIGQGAEKN